MAILRKAVKKIKDYADALQNASPEHADEILSLAKEEGLLDAVQSYIQSTQTTSRTRLAQTTERDITALDKLKKEQEGGKLEVEAPGEKPKNMAFANVLKNVTPKHKKTFVRPKGVESITAKAEKEASIRDTDEASLIHNVDPNISPVYETENIFGLGVQEIPLNKKIGLQPETKRELMSLPEGEQSLLERLDILDSDQSTRAYMEVVRNDLPLMEYFFKLPAAAQRETIEIAARNVSERKIADDSIRGLERSGAGFDPTVLNPRGSSPQSGNLGLPQKFIDEAEPLKKEIEDRLLVVEKMLSEQGNIGSHSGFLSSYTPASITKELDELEILKNKYDKLITDTDKTASAMATLPYNAVMKYARSLSPEAQENFLKEILDSPKFQGMTGEEIRTAHERRHAPKEIVLPKNIKKAVGEENLPEEAVENLSYPSKNEDIIPKAWTEAINKNKSIEINDFQGAIDDIEINAEELLPVFRNMDLYLRSDGLQQLTKDLDKYRVQKLAGDDKLSTGQMKSLGKQTYKKRTGKEDREATQSAYETSRYTPAKIESAMEEYNVIPGNYEDLSTAQIYYLLKQELKGELQKKGGDNYTVAMLAQGISDTNKNPLASEWDNLVNVADPEAKLTQQNVGRQVTKEDLSGQSWPLQQKTRNLETDAVEAGLSGGTSLGQKAETIYNEYIPKSKEVNVSSAIVGNPTGESAFNNLVVALGASKTLSKQAKDTWSNKKVMENKYREAKKQKGLKAFKLDTIEIKQKGTVKAWEKIDSRKVANQKKLVKEYMESDFNGSIREYINSRAKTQIEKRLAKIRELEGKLKKAVMQKDHVRIRNNIKEQKDAINISKQFAKEIFKSGD